MLVEASSRNRAVEVCLAHLDIVHVEMETRTFEEPAFVRFRRDHLDAKAARHRGGAAGRPKRWQVVPIAVAPASCRVRPGAAACLGRLGTSGMIRLGELPSCCAADIILVRPAIDQLPCHGSFRSAAAEFIAFVAAANYPT